MDMMLGITGMVCSAHNGHDVRNNWNGLQCSQWTWC